MQAYLQSRSNRLSHSSGSIAFLKGGITAISSNNVVISFVFLFTAPDTKDIHLFFVQHEPFRDCSKVFANSWMTGVSVRNMDTSKHMV